MLTRRQFLKLCSSTLLTVSISQLGFQVPTSTGTANIKIPVLLYHRIGMTAGALTVTPEQFKKDLNNLKRSGYVSITQKDFQNFIYARDVSLPDKPVFITFDDGYDDNYFNAFPILKEHGMTATFFVITNLLNAPDRLAKAHIREMFAEGMSFGSHTQSHRALGELSYQENISECSGSKKALEDVLGISIESLAYPRGSYNHDTIEAMRQSGYTMGFTVINGRCSRYDNAFVLRRIPLFSYDNNISYVMGQRG